MMCYHVRHGVLPMYYGVLLVCHETLPVHMVCYHDITGVTCASGVLPVHHGVLPDVQVCYHVHHDVTLVHHMCYLMMHSVLPCAS